MAKLLLLIAIFAVVYLVLRSYRRKVERQAAPQPHEHGARSASRHGEDMVRCLICGVHLPRSEAIASRGEIFCSREHLQLADRGGGKG